MKMFYELRKGFSKTEKNKLTYGKVFWVMEMFYELTKAFWKTEKTKLIDGKVFWVFNIYTLDKECFRSAKI